jgi:hypothetical protein
MPGSGQQPATQRVGAGRRVPVVVALAVVLFVGALAWKPWDEPQPAPPPAPPLAAVATTKPEPTPMAAPPSLATPPPATPRPSIAASPVPSEPAGATAAAAQVALTSEPGGAYAQCRYRTHDDGAGNLLARVTVKAPTVIVSRRLARDENVRRVAWQVELQANQLESVFSAEWRTVARSRRQRGAVGSHRPGPF